MRSESLVSWMRRGGGSKTAYIASSCHGRLPLRVIGDFGDVAKIDSGSQATDAQRRVLDAQYRSRDHTLDRGTGLRSSARTLHWTPCPQPSHPETIPETNLQRCRSPFQKHGVLTAQVRAVRRCAVQLGGTNSLYRWSLCFWWVVLMVFIACGWSQAELHFSVMFISGLIMVTRNRYVRSSTNSSSCLIPCNATCINS